MRIHYLQHVPFEDPAYILTWASEKDYPVTRTRLFRDESLPELDAFDWLVIMGGPMSVTDEAGYPWLVAEKRLVGAAIDTGKRVLGICLGAQMIADVLGSCVYRNQYKEIGWLPVSLTPAATSAPAFSGLPAQFSAFHWHGETFDLPEGAVHLASSEACMSQAFAYQQAVALQFHLESTEASVERLLTHCGDELVDAPYIQSAIEIRAGLENIPALNALMAQVLENMAV